MWNMPISGPLPLWDSSSWVSTNAKQQHLILCYLYHGRAYLWASPGTLRGSQETTGFTWSLLIHSPELTPHWVNRWDFPFSLVQTAVRCTSPALLSEESTLKVRLSVMLAARLWPVWYFTLVWALLSSPSHSPFPLFLLPWISTP